MRCCSGKKYLENLRFTFVSTKIFTTVWVNSVITIFTINFNNDFAMTHVRYFGLNSGLSCVNSFSKRLLLLVPISAFYPHFSVLSPFQFPFSVSVSAIQFQRFIPTQIELGKNAGYDSAWCADHEKLYFSPSKNQFLRSKFFR